MRTDERLDAETLAWSLATLLGHLPDALVGALDDEDSFVDMPGSVPVVGQEIVSRGSLADLVTDDERPAVDRTLIQVRESGLGQGNVRLVDGRRAIVHAFDVHEAHGVVVAVAEVLTEVDLDRAGPRPVLRPRSCRVRRNIVGTVTGVDDDAVAMLGWTADELVGRRPSELVHPADLPSSVAVWFEMLQRPGGAARARCRHRCADGSWLWVEVTHRNRLDGPDRGEVVCEIVDISGEVAAERARTERDLLLRHLTGASSCGVLHLDADGDVRFVTPRFRELLGATASSTAAELLAGVVAPDRDLVGRAVERSRRDGARVEVEVRVDGTAPDPPRVCCVVIRPLHDGGGEVIGVVATVRDLVDGGWAED